MGKGNLYYKIARPDGWDFYTGQTINYRDALKNGGIVKPPHPNPMAQLCSEGIIHASRIPDNCFIGGRIPCSIYRVKGIPVVEDKAKGGFTKLRVIQELNPADTFKWHYKQASNPLNPLAIKKPIVDDEALSLLKDWASVWASVWDSVRAYIGHIFCPVINDWLYIKHKRGQYPYQPSVDLWYRGLFPSFNGKVWRLHGHKDARILWEGKLNG